jgi:hypothetical protein
MAKSKKTSKRDIELQASDFWDQESVQEVIPAKKRRAIVSVAFSRDEFARVTNTAKALNKRTSEFIRDAALSASDGSDSFTSARWKGFHLEGTITILIPDENFPESPAIASEFKKNNLPKEMVVGAHARSD